MVGQQDLPRLEAYRFDTHDVTNQVPPLDGFDPLAADPALRDAIVREGAANDYRWSSLILGIVRRVPFQMRRAES